MLSRDAQKQQSRMDHEIRTSSESSEARSRQDEYKN